MLKEEVKMGKNQNSCKDLYGTAKLGCVAKTELCKSETFDLVNSGLELLGYLNPIHIGHTITAKFAVTGTRRLFCN